MRNFIASILFLFVVILAAPMAARASGLQFAAQKSDPLAALSAPKNEPKFLWRVGMCRSFSYAASSLAIYYIYSPAAVNAYLAHRNTLKNSPIAFFISNMGSAESGKWRPQPYFLSVARSAASAERSPNARATLLFSYFSEACMHKRWPAEGASSWKQADRYIIDPAHRASFIREMSKDLPANWWTGESR